jgi:uncharacterized protein with NRDE domain
MCLIVFAWGVRADFPLVVGANRDEFFARPTQGASPWTDAPHVLAGRDLEQGGTWLGVTRTGRMAAVTNYRDGARSRRRRRSRGWLVRDYLLSEQSPERYLSAVHAQRAEYDGFNLIAGSLDGLWHYSNRSAELTRVAPGVHGLSNHLLDTPWPKVERAKRRLRAVAADALPDELTGGLFDILADRALPPDADLPQTGVPIEWERLLASAFIQSADYGTRSSTAVLLDAAGGWRFEERSFAPDGALAERRSHSFAPDSATSSKPAAG